ncbi:MAG: phosphate signaling complex protein PhoU [Acidobacteriota bacterium]|nr:phosphate signaling complex protein PhoU [Acidobacteriota bacterium]
MEHLREELDALNSRLLEMSSLVEDSIARSVNAVVNRDKEEALTVFHNEAQINKLEIQIDNIAIRLLALQQPVAVDLRFVTMSIKINNNLERMGDIAVNIGECALSLLNMPAIKPRIDIPYMAKLAQDMIRNSIDAFVRKDAELARKVLQSDDAVDKMRDEMYAEIVRFMEAESSRVHPGIEHLFVARGLERLADHATNIAEDVLFFVQGVDVRHHSEMIQNV